LCRVQKIEGDDVDIARGECVAEAHHKGVELTSAGTVRENQRAVGRSAA